jgi:hypothetical protein
MFFHTWDQEKSRSHVDLAASSFGKSTVPVHVPLLLAHALGHHLVFQAQPASEDSVHVLVLFAKIFVAQLLGLRAQDQTFLWVV